MTTSPGEDIHKRYSIAQSPVLVSIICRYHLVAINPHINFTKNYNCIIYRQYHNDGCICMHAHGVKYVNNININ